MSEDAKESIALLDWLQKYYRVALVLIVMIFGLLIYTAVIRATSVERQAQVLIAKEQQLAAEKRLAVEQKAEKKRLAEEAEAEEQRLRNKALAELITKATVDKDLAYLPVKTGLVVVDGSSVQISEKDLTGLLIKKLEKLKERKVKNYMIVYKTGLLEGKTPAAIVVHFEPLSNGR